METIKLRFGEKKKNLYIKTEVYIIKLSTVVHAGIIRDVLVYNVSSA